MTQLPPKGHNPQFSTHVCCGQTAGWMRMPLGLEVDLGTGYIVLDGDPAPPPQRGTAPSFRPMSIVVKQLDGSRCHFVGRKASARVTLCQMGTQLPVPQRGTASPNFRSMSIAVKRSPISATAEHLSFSFPLSVCLSLCLFICACVCVIVYVLCKVATGCVVNCSYRRIGYRISGGSFVTSPRLWLVDLRRCSGSESKIEECLRPRTERNFCSVAHNKDAILCETGTSLRYYPENIRSSKTNFANRS